MKVAHTSDWHFRNKDLEECEKVAAFMVEKIAEEKPDVTIIAGDLSDAHDIKAGDPAEHLIVKTVAALAEISPVAIIKGTPSHEGNALEVLRYVRGAFPIRVASVPEQVLLHNGKLVTEVDGALGNRHPDAVITLIPTPTKQFFQTKAGVEASDLEIGHAMSGLFSGFGAEAAEYPGVPHILVTHLNVNGCRLAGGQIRTGMDIEISLDQLNMSGADLHLLGHIHKAQQLGDRTYYSGPIYSTKIDEEGPMGFWIHEIKPGWWNHRFIETPCRRTVRFKRDITEDQPEPVYVDGVAGAHVRYELTTWQDEAGEIDKAGIERDLLKAGALSVDIRINAVPRVNVRAESVLAATTLREEIEELSRLRSEDLEPDILMKAEILEGTPGEELMARITGGGE